MPPASSPPPSFCHEQYPSPPLTMRNVVSSGVTDDAGSAFRRRKDPGSASLAVCAEEEDNEASMAGPVAPPPPPPTPPREERAELSRLCRKTGESGAGEGSWEEADGVAPLEWSRESEGTPPPPPPPPGGCEDEEGQRAALEW